MTNGALFITGNAITLDLQDTVPQTPPSPIQFGSSGTFGLDKFDILKSFALSITGSKTSTRVVILVIGRRIV